MEINNFNENMNTNCDNPLQNTVNPQNISTDQLNNPPPCPRCGAFGTESFCNRCGLDLVAFYQAANKMNQAPPFNTNFTNDQYAINDIPQFAPYTQYSYQMVPNKPKVSTIISVIIMIVLSFLMALSLIFMAINNPKNDKSTSITDKYNDPTISADNQTIRNGIAVEEYNKIKLGMSYAHVSAIAGCDGMLSDSGKLPQGTEYFTYTWSGEPNNKATIHITFKNDVVSEIMQIGLLETENK